MSKDLSKIVTLFIIGLALYLRLAGIQNGFPYVFHPDEPTIVRTALGVRFFPNPGHFDWPHLYVYLNYFIYIAFAKFRDLAAIYGFKPLISSMLPVIWNDELIFYLITRVLTAVLGALTVIPVFLTGKRLFGEKAGLLGALVFALIPFHIRHSHYSLPDAPMVFLLAWAMYYASGILMSTDPINYAGAGAYSGFSASVKYNGGLSAVMVPLAHLMRTLKNKESFLEFGSLMNLFISGLLAAIAFVIGTPYAVMDYATFMRKDAPAGAMWQFKNVGHVDLSERPRRFIMEIANRVSDDLGYVLIPVLIIIIISLLYKLVLKKTLVRDYYAWFLVITALLLIYYVSGFEKPRSHYYMISYPYLAVLFGYFCAQLYDLLESKLKYGIVVIYAVLFIFPLYTAVTMTYTFTNPDTRNLLDGWITEKIPVGKNIVYLSEDLVPVMGKYGGRRIPDLDKISGVQDGYVVLTDVDLESIDNIFTVLKYSSVLKDIHNISTDYRNGPAIKIYEIIR